jgi:hypothetical protein
LFGVALLSNAYLGLNVTKELESEWGMGNLLIPIPD